MFTLVRYVSLASAVALIGGSIVLSVFWYRQQMSDVVELIERQSVTFAQVLANSFGPMVEHVTAVESVAPSQLATLEQTKRLDEVIRRVSYALPLLKVKLYSKSGTTVYSSDPAEIGSREPDTPAAIGAALNHGVTSEAEFRRSFEAPSGPLEDVHIVETYIPVTAEDGAPAGVFELYSDISKTIADKKRIAAAWASATIGGFTLLYVLLLLVIRKAERVIRAHCEETEQHRASAESASEARGRFLADMSHEFRAPLNAVLGYAELLKMQPHGPIGDSRYLQYCESIKKSGDYLLELIEDILDLSRIDAGKMTLEESTINLQECVNDSIDLVRPIADHGDVTLSADVADDCLHLLGDRHLVQQVLLNLLSNAVKFTPPGGQVSVHARLAPEQGIEFDVVDSGCGISEEALPTLTEPFRQARNHCNRKSGKGSGLGLAIVKQLVELHGGTLQLHSRVGEGTRVTVGFPPARTGFLSSCGSNTAVASAE